MNNGLKKVAHSGARMAASAFRGRRGETWDRSRAKRKARFGLAATAAMAFASSLILLPAGPAQAAFGDCPQFKLCVFSEPNGTGAMAVFASGDANLGDSVGPQGMNNNIESFINNTGWHCDFWDYANYTGDIRHADAYQGGVNLGAAWANRITSLRCA